MHTPSGPSFEKTAVAAHELGANCLQIFTSSPRMWRAPKVDPGAAAAMRVVRETLDLRPLVVHANYLINLASDDATIRGKSIAAFRGEIESAAAIGAEFLVVHPGSAKDQPVEIAIAAAAEALNLAALPGTMVLLECTAGQGSALGARLEELRAIRDRLDFEAGYCLDTCHLLAAGYDVATESGLEAVVIEVGRHLGWDHVRVIHANDSRYPLGSRRDRHANIGEGHIGLDGFRRILAHPRFRELPFILETPLETSNGGRWDIERLKDLCPRSPTIIAKSS